jgi:hypothetical protein
VSTSSLFDICRVSLHPRLDSLGIAGFSHDFGTLQGKYSVVAEVLDSFGALKLSFVDIFKMMFSPVFPILTTIPTPRFNLFKKFKLTSKQISRELLERTRNEKKGDVEDKKDHSVMGLLSTFDPSIQGHYGRDADRTFASTVRASSDSSEHPMSDNEVTDQVKTYFNSLYTRIRATILKRLRCIQMTVLIVGGYNTTSSLCSVSITLLVADNCLGIHYSQPYSTSSVLYFQAPGRIVIVL